MVPSMDKGLSEVAEAVEMLTNESCKLRLSFEDGSDKVSVKVDSLADSLGSDRDAGGSSLVAPTLWGLWERCAQPLEGNWTIQWIGGKLDTTVDVVTQADLSSTKTDLEQQAKLTTAATETNIKGQARRIINQVCGHWCVIH